ncbi:putative sulfate transporter 3.5 [Platanthera zijinensis]|uniref:Sulfate transporter 3.5 n=1 Tax=Platanthera zijinensis TaxID=2320716 RepID=A0AAP0G0Z1_9ASPA
MTMRITIMKSMEGLIRLLLESDEGEVSDNIEVGDLKKGLNPITISHLQFKTPYVSVAIKAGLITGIIALAEGVAVGRSLALLKNEQIDGNKEMIAYGMMNIKEFYVLVFEVRFWKLCPLLSTPGLGSRDSHSIVSLATVILISGHTLVTPQSPFSKSAVNYHAGCKTPMSNAIQAVCMMLVLLFLAPLFKYTPLVALSAIITVAMIGIIELHEIRHLFKVDKFDFCLCMSALLGVLFISMKAGLALSFLLSIIRALLYVARPMTCKLGNLPGTDLYRDIQQYPNSKSIPGILILQLGSPIYFANAGYLRER